MAKGCNPGQDMDDKHFSPHGHSAGMPRSSAGQGRGSDGGFMSHAPSGGKSSHGDSAVSRLKKHGKTPSKVVSVDNHTSNGGSGQNAAGTPYDSDADDWL